MLSRRRILSKARLEAFALIDVENVIIAQERNASHDRLTVCTVNDVSVIVSFCALHEFPESDHAGFLALLDMTTLTLRFFESDELTAATAEKHLVEQAVALACRVADRALNAAPRFLPRDNALLKLGDHAIRDNLE